VQWTSAQEDAVEPPTVLLSNADSVRALAVDTANHVIYCGLRDVRQRSA